MRKGVKKEEKKAKTEQQNADEWFDKNKRPSWENAKSRGGKKKKRRTSTRKTRKTRKTSRKR